MYTATLFAGDTVLSWEPPAGDSDGTPLEDLAGYIIYYGTESGSYSQSIDVGNITTYQISNLTDSLTYYFSVVAYDTAGNESDFSNEVSKFMSDFNDGSDNGWDQMSGIWSVEGGEYSEISISENEPAFSLTDIETKDMIIEVNGNDQGTGNSQNFFIVFAYDEVNGKAYWAGARAGADYWSIEEEDLYTGSKISLAYTPEIIDTNTWYHLKVIINGNTVTLYADDEKMASYRFPEGIPKGWTGLGGQNNHALFDNFSVIITQGVNDFFIDFNDGSDNGWDQMSGIWSVEGGEYSEIGISENEPAFSLTDIETKDMIIEVSGNDQGTGNSQNFFIVFAYDEVNGKAYWAGARAGADYWSIEEVDLYTDSKIRLAYSPEIIDTNTWYHLKVIINGDTVTLYADDEEMASYRFPEGIPNGWTGLGGQDNQALFDNFSVTYLN